MENLPSVIPKLSNVRSFFLYRRIPDASDLVLCCRKEKSFSGGVAGACEDHQWNLMGSETPIFSLEG